jgi:hypothetical protein
VDRTETAPSGVTRATRPSPTVNQTAPSTPLATSELGLTGAGNRRTRPVTVIRPAKPEPANHSAPSGPPAMAPFAPAAWR